jgi:hypothetical protein
MLNLNYVHLTHMFIHLFQLVKFFVFPLISIPPLIIA